MKIKYIILLFLLLQSAANNLWGQTGVTEEEKRDNMYQLILTNYSHYVETDNDMCTGYAEFQLNSSNTVLTSLNVPKSDSDRGTLSFTKNDYLIQSALTSMRIKLYAVDAADGGILGWFKSCNIGDRGVVEQIRYEDLNTVACSVYHLDKDYGHHTEDDGIQWNHVVFDYQLLPLHYLTTETINGYPNTFLPSDDKVTLSAKSGFRADLYHYQYRLQGSGDWTEIPDSFCNTAKDKLTLSARDLLGDSYIDYFGQNIHFRVVSCFDGNDFLSWSNTVSLMVIPSTPRITGASYTLPVCHGENNAAITLTFDRDAYTGERVYFSQKDSITDEYNIKGELHINAGSALISNLEAGTYGIGLYGTYHYGNDTINTFSQDGENHRINITIPERPKVTYSAYQDSVHCLNGRDGRIAVSAVGGAGKYRACLFAADNLSDTLQTLSLNENTTVYFTELKAGSYVVHLRDTVLCEPQYPDLSVQTVEILQPLDPVRINDIDFLEPLAYGYSDGEAWAYIIGGTGTAYTAVWKDSADMSRVLAPEPLQREGDRMKTHLKGLKKGKYYLYVYDENYSDVNPKTLENECGCTATDSIVIGEPPMLTVEISERHYVTCYGDNDGVIAAHAAGGRPYIPADGKSFPYDYRWYKITASGDSLFAVNDSILSDIYSGQYKVTITDRNGIEKTSQVFELVQPDKLLVTVQVLQNVLCDGESAGKLEAFVTGGTPPYTYFWTSGDTTKVADGLTENIYTVFVRDARYFDSQTHYCSASALGEILSPDGLNIAETLTDPACNAASTGSITLNVTGGKQPYAFMWNDGSASQDRVNLAAGDYSVTLTDANGCKISESYTLAEPPAIGVDLGEDITLCKDQTLNIAGTVSNADENDLAYLWTYNGSNISAEKELAIDRAGTYKLQISNSAGCTADDEISVSQSEEELYADFAAATRIPKGIPVYAVNIMRTAADSVRWLLPENAVITENTADRIQFRIDENGTYSAGMAAYKGECRDILYKSIEVVDDSQIEKYNAEEPFLKNFVVYPNPNSGNFSVRVELSKPADYTLQLYGESGLRIAAKEIKNSMFEETQFADSDNIGSGVYFLHFVCTAEQTVSVYKVVIN